MVYYSVVQASLVSVQVKCKHQHPEKLILKVLLQTPLDYLQSQDSLLARAL